jgi:DNA gyrase subunit A
MSEFALDEIQAKAILDMQFRRLTGLERDRIEREYNELLVKIADLQDILDHHERVMTIIKEELMEIRDKYADARRSEIIDAPADMEDEDLIPVENIVITLSANGYIKRMTTDNYRVQNRGGKGIKGMELNKDDVIDQFVSMSTHDNLLVLTDKGRVFRIKGYNIPEFSRTSKGIPAVNLIQIDRTEKIKAFVPYSNDDNASFLFFVTKNGLIKKTSIEEFKNINRNGKIAIKLNDDDELVEVKATNGEAEIIIAGSNGKAVRFKEDTVRPLGRTARGVRGFNTDGGKVIGMATSEEGNYILTVTENGYGKKSLLDDYRMTSRGAKGVKTVNVNEKTGNLVCMKAVNGDEDCMIMTDSGIIIRISLKQVSVYNRSARGVHLINVKDDQKVSTVEILAAEPEETETMTETAETPEAPAEAEVIQ